MQNACAAPARRLLGAVRERRRSLIALWIVACVLPLGELRADSVPSIRGSFFALSVRDINQAVDWYTTHLGFTVVSTAKSEARNGALLERSSVLLELAEFPDSVDRPSDSESYQVFGIFKIGLQISDLERAYRLLEEGGVEIYFPIVIASDGRRTFGVKDMDGNVVQLFGHD